MKRFFGLLFILMIGMCAIAIGCSDGATDDRAVFDLRYSASQGGAIIGESYQTVERGRDGQSVTAVADDGYIFVGWSDGVTTAERTDTDIQTDIAVCADFDKTRFSVKYTAEGSGAIFGTSEQTVEYGSTAEAVYAVPFESYEFVKWSDGVEDATRTDADIRCDIAVSAIFKKITYSVVYATDGNGVVSGLSEQTVEYGQDSDFVRAVPNEGYEFVEWSDGVKKAYRNNNNVKADVRITAVFKKKTYRVVYLPGDPAKGSIQGDSDQAVEYGDDCTTVTAVPKEGYEFNGWSDGYPDPVRTDHGVTDNIRVSAYFSIIRYTVTYKSAIGGAVVNESQVVFHGDQTSRTARVQPWPGYVFVRWSDGLTTPERNEYNVTSDMEFTAYFGYSAEYKIDNDICGTIKGETYQKTIPGEDFAEVEAVPYEGYAFSGWSDLKTSDKRQDTEASFSTVYYAYFEPIGKTFDYDYGIANGVPMENSVTLNRENIALEGYPTPSLSGYSFEGWYADENYELKVIDDGGAYMLGYYGFTLETDTLYARWKADDDVSPTFKILMLFVNELDAMLYPAKIGGDGIERHVHHIMTTIDREYCAYLRESVSRYLTDWLSGMTEISVDAYFSINAASEKHIIYTKGESDAYTFITSDFPEMASLYTKYNSIMNIFGTNDYDGVLANRSVAGSAGFKYGDVYLETLHPHNDRKNNRLREGLIKIRTNERRCEDFIETSIHEFIHTVEQAYKEGDIMSYHRSYYSYFSHVAYDPIEASRLYLVNEMEYNGEVGGIPTDFWKDVAHKMLSLTWYQAL